MKRHGFSLINLAAALMVLGLLAGALLTTYNLLTAARIRWQIKQITGLYTAVNSFIVKYEAQPGDIPAKKAKDIGFAERSGLPGEGDGNGSIGAFADADPGMNFGGENALYWNDLAAAQFIEGDYSKNVNASISFSLSETQFHLPKAMLGDSNVFVVTKGAYALIGNLYASDGLYTAISFRLPSDPEGFHRIPGITPMEAFAIDTRIDDGYSDSGTVGGGLVLSNPTITSILPDEHTTSGGCLVPSASGKAYNLGDRKYARQPICVMRFTMK